MVNFFLLAGGYGSTIVTYLFNSTSSTLSLQSTTSVGENPSWIFKHPTKPSILYATNEGESGQVQSFTVNGNGLVSAPVASISSGGNGPAHAAYLSSGKIAAMNYGSGDGRIISISSDGLHFQEPIQSISFKASSSVTSHPHQAVEYNSNVLVPDLGQDKIFRLSKDGKIQGSISQPQGSGPRHIAIANDRLYTLHELSSTLSVQSISSDGAAASVLDTVSIIPPTQPAGAVYAAAEILIPPATSKFPTRYIYASNRNIGPQTNEGDTIAIYENVGDRLKLVKQVYTGLIQPRGMEFTSDGEYLAVAGVAGEGGVAIFQRTEGGRNLVEVARNKNVPTRTSFVWI